MTLAVEINRVLYPSFSNLVGNDVIYDHKLIFCIINEVLGLEVLFQYEVKMLGQKVNDLLII